MSISLDQVPQTTQMGYGDTMDAFKAILNEVGYHPHPADLDRMVVALFAKKMHMVRLIDDTEHLIATVKLNIEIAEREALNGAHAMEWSRRSSEARMLAREFIAAAGPEDFEAVKILAELATRKIKKPRA